MIGIFILNKLYVNMGCVHNFAGIAPLREDRVSANPICKPKRPPDKTQIRLQNSLSF